MDSEIVFGAPPPSGGRRRVTTRFAPALDVLRAAPGEWARIAVYPSRSGAWHVPASLQRAGVTGFEFQVQCSRTKDESAVWACYVGDKEEATAA